MWNIFLGYPPVCITWIIGVVDAGSVESRLQDEGEEKGPEQTYKYMYNNQGWASFLLFSNVLRILRVVSFGEHVVDVLSDPLLYYTCISTCHVPML